MNTQNDKVEVKLQETTATCDLKFHPMLADKRAAIDEALEIAQELVTSAIARNLQDTPPGVISNVKLRLLPSDGGSSKPKVEVKVTRAVLVTIEEPEECGTCDGSQHIPGSVSGPHGEMLMRPCPTCQPHKEVAEQ